MGIIKRFVNMMKANANAKIDEMERPEAMLDQCIRDMKTRLAQVKADTANVLATKIELERKISLRNDEIELLTSYATEAVKAGNDDDARKFLIERDEKQAEIEELNASLTVVSANAAKMRVMHDQLCSDIEKASERSGVLKSKIKVTKTQDSINSTMACCTGAEQTFEQFDSLDERITRKMDEAFALEEINTVTDPDSVESLKDKYSAKISSDKIEAELAALKEQV